MQQNTITKLDRIQRALFSPQQDEKNLDKATKKAMRLRKPLTKDEKKTLERYQAAFTFWQNNPHLSKKDVANFIMNTFNLQKTAAYQDTQNVERLLGNVKISASTWLQHMVNEMCRQAYILAKAKGDAKGMILAADKLGKYNKLDKDEIERIPWESLIPPNFEPVPDVTVLGLEPITNIEEKRKQLRERYKRKYEPSKIEDAVIINDDN